MVRRVSAGQIPTEKARWFRRAAGQGCAAAQNRLGSLYYKGDGVPADRNEAARWYRMAADQGDATAQGNMSLYLARVRVHAKNTLVTLGEKIIGTGANASHAHNEDV